MVPGDKADSESAASDLVHTVTRARGQQMIKVAAGLRRVFIIKAVWVN